MLITIRQSVIIMHHCFTDFDYNSPLYFHFLIDQNYLVILSLCLIRSPYYHSVPFLLNTSSSSPTIQLLSWSWMKKHAMGAPSAPPCSSQAFSGDRKMFGLLTTILALLRVSWMCFHCIALFWNDFHARISLVRKFESVSTLMHGPFSWRNWSGVGSKRDCSPAIECK